MVNVFPLTIYSPSPISSSRPRGGCQSEKSGIFLRINVVSHLSSSQIVHMIAADKDRN